MGEPAETATETATEVRTSKTLWYGMFFSPIVWSIHTVVGYALAEASCYTGLLNFQVSGISILMAVLVALTLLAIVGTVWNGWWSYRSWRYYASLSPEEEHPLQAFDRDEFLALSGLLLSGIFTLLLLLNIYPFVVLRPCV